MSLRSLSLLLLAAACGAEDAVPTHLRVKATFTRADKDGKDEVYASPQVITVDGRQTSINIGSADDGVAVAVIPRVGKDGTITLETSLDIRHPIAPALGVSPQVTPTAKPPTQKDYPSFHAVLVADKLFSIENAAGNRKWLLLGIKVDGWTLKSYDAKREALTITRLGRSLELVLNKAVIETTPPAQVSRAQSNSTVTVQPGVRTLVSGSNGQTISLEAEVLDLSK